MHVSWKRRRGRPARISSLTLELILEILAVLPWDHMVGNGCLSVGRLTRVYLLRYVWRSLSRTLDAAFPAPGASRALSRFLLLVGNCILVLHWFACIEYATARRAAALVGASNTTSTWFGATQLEQRPIWARYLRSFDRGCLVVLGEGVHGDTDIEIGVSMLGLLAGTGLVAFFTSTVVEIVRSTNKFQEEVREKIGRVRDFLHDWDLPHELQRRCVQHLLHFMLERRSYGAPPVERAPHAITRSAHNTLPSAMGEAVPPATRPAHPSATRPPPVRRPRLG